MGGKQETPVTVDIHHEAGAEPVAGGHCAHLLVPFCLLRWPQITLN